MVKKMWLFSLMVVSLAFVSFAVAEGDEPEESSPPAAFESYWMVFLERGDNPPQLDEEASAKVQRQHLGHLSKVRREGYSLVAGPFEVPADEPLRGIVLYRGDLEEAEVVKLANADPAVLAGRLKVRVMKWWTGAGAVQFPKAEVGK